MISVIVLKLHLGLPSALRVSRVVSTGWVLRCAAAPRCTALHRPAPPCTALHRAAPPHRGSCQSRHLSTAGSFSSRPAAPPTGTRPARPPFALRVVFTSQGRQLCAGLHRPGQVTRDKSGLAEPEPASREVWMEAHARAQQRSRGS